MKENEHGSEGFNYHGIGECLAFLIAGLVGRLNEYMISVWLSSGRAQNSPCDSVLQKSVTSGELLIKFYESFCVVFDDSISTPHML